MASIPPGALPATRLRLPRGALARIGRDDPRMRKLVAKVGPFRLELGRSQSHLGALVRSIVYQQLSGKAAARIHERFREACEGSFPDARIILAASEETLRGCGLSRQKIASLRDLCARVTSGSLRLSDLDARGDAEVIDVLTQVRGIGIWSAQMFLMFHLGRVDVWPSSDLGIRKAVQALTRARDLPSPKDVDARGELYRPYRTIASRYLWRLIDGDAGEW